MRYLRIRPTATSKRLKDFHHWGLCPSFFRALHTIAEDVLPSRRVREGLSAFLFLRLLCFQVFRYPERHRVQTAQLRVQSDPWRRGEPHRVLRRLLPFPSKE